MVVESTAIPKGSYEIRVWADGDDPQTAPILTVMNLLARGDTAVVSMAKGELSDEVNVLVGLEALKLGFRHLEFKVVSGEKVTRHAQFVRSDGVHDCHAVDLVAKRREIFGGQGDESSEIGRDA